MADINVGVFSVINTWNTVWWWKEEVLRLYPNSRFALVVSPRFMRDWVVARMQMLKWLA